jgi:hypothetical protein
MAYFRTSESKTQNDVVAVSHEFGNEMETDIQTRRLRNTKQLFLFFSTPALQPLASLGFTGVEF